MESIDERPENCVPRLKRLVQVRESTEVATDDPIVQSISEPNQVLCLPDQLSGFRRLCRDHQLFVDDFDRHPIRDAEGNTAPVRVRPVLLFAAQHGVRLPTPVYRILSTRSLCSVFIAVQQRCVD